MQESHALPFEHTAESIGDWLLSIDRLFLPEKINLLNGVLNELASAQIEKNTQFLLLDKLTESVLLLSGLLEHNALRPNYEPEKARKWMTVAIQLSKKLSFVYGHLADQDALPDTQRLVCAYRALQILCLLNKRTSLFYEAPDPSIWKKFAELYLLAEAKQWLKLTIDDRIPGLIAQPTIEAVIQHALLFHSCHPHRHNPSDIDVIFVVAAKLAHHTQLDSQKSDYALCHWRPDALLPPECVDAEKTEQRVLSLDTAGVANLFEIQPEKQAKLETIPGLLNRLTAYQDIRRSVDPLKSKKCGMILGSDHAAKFLNILISRYRVMELSGMNQSNLKASGMELVPMEIKNTMASLSSTLFADVKNVSTNQLTIFNTIDRAFHIAKIGNISCSQDEPAVLVQEGLPPCFAVIRHIRIDSNTNYRNILLERIEGDVYPVEIQKIQGFVVIRPDSERADLFLPPDDRHGNGNMLATERGIIDASIKIEKFLELTAKFVRYEVSFC